MERADASARARSGAAGHPRHEMERSRKLMVPNLETPYFHRYLIDEEESFQRHGPAWADW